METGKKITLAVFLASGIVALIVMSKIDSHSDLSLIRYPLIAVAVFSGMSLIIKK